MSNQPDSYQNTERKPDLGHSCVCLKDLVLHCFSCHSGIIWSRLRNKTLIDVRLPCRVFTTFMWNIERLHFGANISLSNTFEVQRNNHRSNDLANPLFLCYANYQER